MTLEDPEQHLDAGETLIEVIIAMLIMGVLFVAILAGFGTSIAVSVLHKQQATEQTIARDFSEYLQFSNDVAYKNCGSVADYQSAVNSFKTTYALPGGSHPLAGATPEFTLTVNSVAYWDGDKDTPHFVSGCSPDLGLQRFELTVQSVTSTTKDGPTSAVMQVVKRK